jgi:hypothetical protein
MTGIRFRVRADNARRVAQKFGRTASQFERIIDRRMEQAGDFMVQKIYRHPKIVPRDTGHLSRGIGWRRGGSLVIHITGEAIDPETGFDYFPVSRFGHETELILPSHHFVGVGILYWETPDGLEVFSTFSRGFHPSSDWTDKAEPLAREVVRRTGRLIARDIMQELER